ERVADAEDVFERARHGPAPGAAGEHKRAIDVEKNDRGGQSLLAANVARARALGRRLLIEGHALAFVQRIEAALHRATVEEPLLAAVVADESEASVPNESFD